MRSDPRPEWRAMRHADYREWAQEVLGEQRQVYARDIREPADAPLRFMAPGEARRLHREARAGHLICPVPGCPSPELTTRGPVERRHHFVHRHAPADAGHGRTYARRVTVRLLREWLTSQSAGFEVTEDATVDGVSVTLLVRSPRSGRQVALIYVDGRFGAGAWGYQYYRLKAADVPASWIFALRSMFFALPQPSRAAAPDDPVREDRDRGDLVLDRALYRTMRSAGVWPLLLSLERGELANLLPPHGRIAEQLELRPPASAERVLHLLPSPLATARLTCYGVATSAVIEAVLEQAWRADPPKQPAPQRAAPPRSTQPEPGVFHEQVPPREPLAATDPPASAEDERKLRWSRARSVLHKRLGDPELAKELAEPLPTDVECGLLAEHWHTMLAVWLRRRTPPARDAQALQARLHDLGAGPALSTSAVAGFLSWWNERHGRPRVE